MTDIDRRTPPGKANRNKRPDSRVGSTQQVDDNQDDLGRDVNSKSEPSTNEVRPDKLRNAPRP